MTNRLKYETSGGDVSEALTFGQLTEYLRLAEECCYTIGHINKSHHNNRRGEAWLQIGKLLAKVNNNVAALATSKESNLS